MVPLPLLYPHLPLCEPVQQELRRTLVSSSATGRALLQAEHFDADSAWTLVAVNPYKELPGVLSDDTAATYRDRSVQELEATPPHLYAVVVSRVTITICMFEWVGDEATVSHSRRSTTA